MVFKRSRRSPRATGETTRSRRSADLSALHFYVRMTAIFMVVLLSGLSAGIVLERFVIDEGTNRSPQSDLEAVASVLEENYYYRPSGASDQEVFRQGLERKAIEGMLTSLDDRYTRYLVPEEAQVASDQLAGAYGGIGVTVQAAHGLLVVARVTADSPASRAGVAAGDVIQRIDGRAVDEGGESTIAGDLRGPVGTAVELLIQRPGEADAIRLSLTREEIIVHPVSLEMIRGTSYARIRIDIFGDRTTAELDEAIVGAGTRGATGIVLDLRGNGGGWVTSAQETIGRFVAAREGPALIEDAEPGEGGEYTLPILNPDVAPTDLPIVVLVDRNTASAAEIVAGSLRDHNRALIVGEQTFGKGSVQRIFNFDDGASLRVTVAEWITPNKSRIENAGIVPDLMVDSAAYGRTSGDPFIRVAMSLLESGISRPTDLADAGGTAAFQATPAAPRP